MKGNDMKKEKKFNASYLLCLVPISSILIFLGLMIIPDKFIYLGSIPIWVPIAQQGLSGISVISVLIVIAAVLIWGRCGAIAARKRGKLLVSTLVAHAIPIISMVLYIIYKLIAAFGGGKGDIFCEKICFDFSCFFYIAACGLPKNARVCHGWKCPSRKKLERFARRVPRERSRR